MASNVIPFPRALANDNRTDPTPPPPYAGAPVLKVIDGIVDPKMTFLLAFNEAMIASAERDLVEARWAAAHRLGNSAALSGERDAAFARQLTAAVRLAETPAMTRQQIKMKKRGIGHVWLHAEGDFYEPFRQGVARDEARLSA
jgi:hypothetical protein